MNLGPGIQDQVALALPGWIGTAGFPVHTSVGFYWAHEL